MCEGDLVEEVIQSARGHDDGDASDGVFCHPNIGKTVIYRAGCNRASQKPAVILAQRGSVVDVLVFTYHGTVTQEGAVLIGGIEAWKSSDENVCWLP